MEPSRQIKQEHLEDSTESPPSSTLPENHLSLGISKLEHILAEKRELLQKLRKQADSLQEESSDSASSSAADSVEVGAADKSAAPLSPTVADAQIRLPSAAELREQVRLLEDYISEISYILSELTRRLKEHPTNDSHTATPQTPSSSTSTLPPPLPSPSIITTSHESSFPEEVPAKMKRENSGKDKSEKRDVKREDSDKKKEKGKSMKRENSKDKDVDSPASGRKVESLSSRALEDKAEDKTKRRLKAEKSSDGSMSARESRRSKEDRPSSSDKPPRAPEEKPPKS